MDATEPVEGLSPEEMVAQIDERMGALTTRGEEIRAEVARLTLARKALLGQAREAKRKRKASEPVDRPAERQAGPGNVRRVFETLVSLGGRATQHMLTEQTGLNSGTMTYALRALEERGSIRRTGVSVRRSDEVEVVASSVRMPPGSAGQ